MRLKDLAPSLLSNISTGIMVLNRDFGIIFSNQACEQILGISTAKMKGSYFPDIFSYSSIDFRKLLTAASEEKEVFSISNAVLVTAHEKIFCDVTISSFSLDTAPHKKDPALPPGESLLLFEFKKVSRERVMEHERQQESQQNAARDLVRSLAHEIKNPLGGLRGAAQLIQKEYNHDSSLCEYCNIIIEQADRLKNLVDRLLGPQKAVPAAKALTDR